ncbi:MAG: hypothetical protein ABSB82_00585 [Terriglobia bacterium]|jgi:hypothetical protein
MSDSNWLDLGRKPLRAILVVGYGQVVLGVLYFALLFLRVGRGLKAPYLEALVCFPLLPGFYVVAPLLGKPAPGLGTPLPLVLALVLNCVIYSGLWLAGATLWRRVRRHHNIGTSPNVV